jgi:hypothetical protein
MMFRNENTIVTQLNFANQLFLANATLISEQTEVGIVTLPNNQGYVALMLDYLNFAVDTEVNDEAEEVILDYVIIQ